MKIFRFGKKFLIAIFLIPVLCALILLGRNNNILAFARLVNLDNMHVSEYQADLIQCSSSQKNVVNPFSSKVKILNLTYGNKAADKRIMLYISPTCNSCCKLFLNDFNTFKNLVDTSNGKTSMEIKPYISSRGDLDVAKMLYILPTISESNSPEFDALNILLNVFRNQKKWMNSQNPRELLKNLFVNDYSKEMIDFAIKDKEQKDKIISKYKKDYAYYAKRSASSLPMIVIYDKSTDLYYQYDSNLAIKNILKFINDPVSFKNKKIIR